MTELGKTFLRKNQIKIFKKNQKINVKMRHVNKKPRNGHLVETKKTRPRMNYGWIGKTTKKKTDPKKRKKQ